MKKIQKPKRLAGNLEGEGGPSKAKKQKTKMHTWSEHPDMPEGETLATLRTYADEHRDEVKKTPKSRNSIKILWRRHLPFTAMTSSQHLN